jgi:Protein of unknown function (DUF2384)
MARTQKSQKPGEVEFLRGEECIIDEIPAENECFRSIDLSPDEIAVINRAVDVIGDREKAMRWLGTPVRALGYSTPISRLKDETGAKEVMDLLAALEQGSW